MNVGKINGFSYWNRQLDFLPSLADSRLLSVDLENKAIEMAVNVLCEVSNPSKLESPIWSLAI